MAGVLRVNDTDGSSRTVSAVRVRDTDGTDRVLQFIRVLDADGVTSREVFTASGGPAPSGAVITPPYRTYSGKGYNRSATFTASSTDGTPTSFLWGVLDGNGTVAANGTTATATLQVYVDQGDTQTAVFFCDMVVAGVTSRATCQLTYTNTTGGQLQ